MGNDEPQIKNSMKPHLTIEELKSQATIFAEMESRHDEPTIYAVTDGKRIGTYAEHKFKAQLNDIYSFSSGSSASGIDLPGLNVDLKVTSTLQPQSSCPYRSPRQKIYGLGYHLLIFVYKKSDDENSQTGRLTVHHIIFVDKESSADYQTTRGILEILDRDGNEDDLVAFMNDRNLPVDDIGAQSLAREIIQNPPKLGYLTISNALQWRLQFGRVIEQAGSVNGLE